MLSRRCHSQIIFCVGLVISLSSVITTTSADYDLSTLSSWIQEINNDPTVYRTPKALWPEVQTKNGTIRGQVVYSGFTKIYRFLGIPYAAPPVGPLRFQPPQPYEGWGEGTYQATKQPNACPQILTNLTRADEDCLFLSVYTRRNGDSDDERLLPVIYFIHGGGYVFGQNSYYPGAKLLKDEEVVLVSVQYRLGTLGFFATGDNTVSANNGMKDMVQGLRWVQENIAAFGGDPNQVTVMGESAGSASALYMLISPLAQGLFHRVIAMSGSPLQEWAIDRNPQESARRLAALVECPADDNKALLECLKEMKWGRIAKGGIDLILEDFKNFKINLHGTTPVIEGDIPGAFLTDDPLKLLREGPLPNVEVMLGAVQHEGILPVAAAHFLVLEPEGRLNDSSYMKDYFLGDILRTYGVDERRDGASVSQALSLAFLPQDADLANFDSYKYELLDAMSVLFMKAPILRTANILSRRLPAVYLYSFEYYSKNSLYHIAYAAIQLIGGTKPIRGKIICHGDDLAYVFKLPVVLSAKDKAFSKKYVKLFTNFASSGNPTPQAEDGIPVWPKYDDSNKSYMRLSEELEIKNDYRMSWRQPVPPYNS